MTFQFSLWDKFKELSNLPSSTFNNLSQLVTCFLQRKCLSISILKVGAFHVAVELNFNKDHKCDLLFRS